MLPSPFAYFHKIERGTEELINHNFYIKKKKKAVFNIFTNSLSLSKLLKTGKSS